MITPVGIRAAGARRWFAESVVLLALGAVGCGDDEPELPPLGAPFDCAEPIDLLDDLPDGYREFAGVVALPQGEQLQLGGSGMDFDLGSSRRFAKFGLLIRPQADFQLHVGPQSQFNALIDWGNTVDGRPAGSLAFSSCPGDPATWLAYPGGVWLYEPSCTELVVITKSTTATRRLPVGAGCP